MKYPLHTGLIKCSIAGYGGSRPQMDFNFITFSFAFEIIFVLFQFFFKFFVDFNYKSFYF